MTVAIADAVVDAEIVRTADEWADVIKGNLGRAVGEIVAAGQNLIAAKADLGHGEWLPMLRLAGIGEDAAGRLMRIARNEALANSATLRNLPASPSALYTLSALDAATINAGIERGDIHPGMTIKDAKGYAAEVTDHAPANVNAETGEIADEPTTPTRDTEREVSIVNDLRLYLRHIGTDKAITGLSSKAKQAVIEALEDAATNLKESMS